MKTLLKAVFTGFILSFIITQTFFTAECEEMPNNLLRLHILANSDSEEDQQLKLKVRDYILQEAGDMFKQADNKIEAVHITKTNLDRIIDKAQKYVNELGYSYEVKGEIKEDMYFNTREYDDFTLPAGRYDALRITIGEGKGHNWWCVMFPPMCFSMAEGDSNDLSEVLTDEQLEIAENQDKYEYKFKVVEIYNEIKNFFTDDEDK
ncbi:MAG: stage II sporulation protein R [Acutalibacteraceae bacterium]|nr:stage II sporulation protein R [Acutalibacteraceae bacterium]